MINSRGSSSATPRRRLDGSRTGKGKDGLLTQVRREEGLQWHAEIRDAVVARSIERIADRVDARQQQPRRPQQQNVHVRPAGLAHRRRLAADPRGCQRLSATAGPAADAQRGGVPQQPRVTRLVVLRRRRRLSG